MQKGGKNVVKGFHAATKQRRKGVACNFLCVLCRQLICEGHLIKKLNRQIYAFNMWMWVV